MKKITVCVVLSFFSFAIHAQKLFDAYKSKDYKKLEQLLEKGTDPNQLDKARGLPLMFDAAWNNDVVVMELLYKYGGKVDGEYGTTNVTFLLAACQQNSFEAVKFLVLKGADVSRKNTKAGNQTPIRFACKTGNVELVSFLLDKGANIEDTPDDKITPIIQAVQRNHYALVMFLIQKGANVNACARDKETALNQAIIKNNVEIVELLLKHGADATAVDKDGNSCLELTKKTKNEKLVKMIQEKL